MIELIKKWFKELTAIPEINADNSYRLAKYGKVVDENAIFCRCIRDINGDIDYKCVRGSFSLTVDVIDDVSNNLPKIIEFYTSKGYYVRVLEIEDIPGKYLFISWRKQQK